MAAQKLKAFTPVNKIEGDGYEQDFHFYQAGTDGLLGMGIDQMVGDAGGICGTVSIGWLSSRLREVAWVFSEMDVRQDKAMYDKYVKTNYSDVFIPALEEVVDGKFSGNYEGGISIRAADGKNAGAAIADMMDAHAGVLVVLADGNRRDLGGGSHVIAFKKQGKEYLCFDPNIGQYHASKQGAANWANDLFKW
eukprot:CAMPEP_0204843600 /NCGR_PEP_ID=MMETSP1346-20131115/48072_1 /ASSEMBLY_ACC=CAM_ASM_000771 /TAXON_ID=215587 /ORGANISM="Aplanochytrium stocchinoi, Strain GSBS06" /LENGTH=192 /DNA_ID=CAMNT_0051982765 /DNA_START=275 /DNA_END=850 /DNA_ORIENTATION=-